MAQQKQYLGTPDNIVEVRGGLMADSAFYYGRRDTNFIPVRTGCVVQRPSDNIFYIYQTVSAVTRWYKMTPTAGAGISISTDNVISATGSGTVNSKYSITQNADTVLLVNDTSLSSATGLKFSYQIDSTGRRAYQQDKYIACSSFDQLRGLRIPDTSYIYRVNVQGVIGDYFYQPNDHTTTDDTVITVVSREGYRYRRYIPDGVFDPHWWGAKGDGVTDDTRPIQLCLTAIKKYHPLRGATMRLTGEFVFDPTYFPYPDKPMVIQLTGRAFPKDTWVLPYGISIIGVGGAYTIAQFVEGPVAEVYFNIPGTDQKPAIELRYGGQLLKNLSIISFEGIGVRLQGIGGYAAALSTLENVGVDCNSFAGEQIGIQILDWFWARFLKCASNVQQGPGDTLQGSSVKIVGKSGSGTTQLSYLLYFDHLITQARPFRIEAGPNADPGVNVPIFNIACDHCTFENLQYDTAAVILNSTNIGIQNVLFNMCATADCPLGTYFLKNIGEFTSGITINSPFDQYLVTGDYIKGLVINNSTIASPFVLPVGMNDMYTSSGHYNGINYNRGWKGGIDLIKATGGQISRSASDFAAFVGDAAAPFPGFNLDTVAVKLYPGVTYRDVVFKTYIQPYHTGDKFIFGCWVKMDTVKVAGGTSLHANFSFGSNYRFEETDKIEFDDISFYQQAKDWIFMTGLVTVDATHETASDVLRLGLRMKQPFDTVYISNAFCYKIDSSSGISQNDALSWAKEHLGGGYNISAGNYYLNTQTPVQLSDSARFYKGVYQRLDGSGNWVNAVGLLTGDTLRVYSVRAVMQVVTSNKTLTLSDAYSMDINAQSGNITITLPAAGIAFDAAKSMGAEYEFRRIDNTGNTVTIQTAGGDTVNGIGNFSLPAQYDTKRVKARSISTWGLFN